MAHFDPSSREEEAREEIAATRVARPLAATLLAFFLALLASGPALETVAALGEGSEIWTELPHSDGGTLAHARAIIAELEARFDHRSELVRRVRPPAQELLLAALHYGNERAYVGRDGWLFFRPDFDHLTSPARSGELEAAAAAVIDFRDRLAAAGVALVVVPAPVKLAIEPERFVAGAPVPPLRPAAEAAWRAALDRAGVEVLDPAPRLARIARSGRAAYLARDTHWRPEAMDEVARELAVVLRGVAALPPGEAGRHLERALAVEGAGDTAALLGLPAGRGGLARERVEIRPVSAPDGAPFRPTRGAPVLLLGDSFSAVFSQSDLGWGAGGGLGERLAFHLGLPVDRILRNAGGASATRAALADELARDPARLDGVLVVVWQLAAREITQGEWRPIRFEIESRR